MSKQSSVEWIIEQIEAGKIEIVYSDKIHSIRRISSIVEQAKAMHKQEIMQTYSDGLGNGMHFERGDGSGKDLDEEQYYKDNFA